MNTPNPPTPARGRGWTFLLVPIAAATGLYAGARWHATVGPLFGMREATPAGTGQRNGAKQLWTCGMHPQVIRDQPGECPICHMELTPLKVDDAAAGQGRAAGGEAAPAPGGPAQGRKVKYWWDPMMSPPYISDRPGKSPMGMDLVPVYEDEGGAAGAQVVIDPAVVQNMGVRVAEVVVGPLRRSVRLVGYLDEAQPNIHDVNLRVSGWVRHLYAATEGMHVLEGDPLFDLYSPELQVGIEELIAGRRAAAAGMAGEAGGVSGALYEAAAAKLALLGLDPRQIEVLARLDRAPPVITFTSPVTGHVTEKPMVEGAAVSAGEKALRIVDHTTLWLDARAFEKDLPFVRVGQDAVATVASGAAETIRGRVIFIHPHVDPMTRAATVRLEIPNPTLTLRPGMYATVRLEALHTERTVLVPREAVLDTGESQVALVALGVGRFEPRRVRLGLAGSDGIVQVLEGLAPGEAVVTSGQFLIDTESRLQEAIQKFLNQKTVASDGPGTPVSAAPAPPPAPPAPVLSTEQQEALDGVVASYLDLSDALGAPQQSDAPLDPGRLTERAHALHGALAGTGREQLAAGVAQAAETMRGHPIDHQRERFVALSEAVISLANALPPSDAVGPELYVMNCPMAPGGGRGDWIQRTPELANPFFGTNMKRCGEQVRTITARAR